MKERKRVLIVDDDLTLLKIAEELLSERYAVSLAKSGEAALRLLERGFLPDLILLDVYMPEMDGFETLKRLQKIKDAELIPVAFLTGCAVAEMEVQGFMDGAVDHIKKPFVKEVLLSRIHAHIEIGIQRRLLHALQSNKKKTDIDEAKFEALTGHLSNTERKVALLIALGYTNQEIGEDLNYSYYYVKKVVTNIFEKLGLDKRYKLKKLFL